MLTMSDWVRLGRHISRARVARGWNTSKSMADAIGISDRTLRDFENAKRDNMTPSLRARIEPALGWEIGSIDVILAGGDPILAQPLEPQPDVIVENVEGALGVSLAHVAGELSPEAKAAFLRELRNMGIIDDDEEI